MDGEFHALASIKRQIIACGDLKIRRRWLNERHALVAGIFHRHRLRCWALHSIGDAAEIQRGLKDREAVG